MPNYKWTVEFEEEDDEDAKATVQDALEEGIFTSLVREELTTEDGRTI